MSFPEAQKTELNRVYSGAAEYVETGKSYFLLPQLVLPDGCSPAKIDALLCPSLRDGYPSRLFFAERINSNVDRNWNSNNIRIIEKKWHAFSWKVNQPNLSLVQLVLSHLGALR